MARAARGRRGAEPRARRGKVGWVRCLRTGPRWVDTLRCVRVLLDTNIWSYVGDQRAEEELRSYLHDHDLHLVLAPCVLLEVIKTPRRDVRDRVLRAMVTAPGERLRTEVDLECDEIVSEVRRLHPEWLRQVPNRPRVSMYRQFWLRDVWRSAVKRADAGSNHLEATIAPQIDMLVQLQRANQAELRSHSRPVVRDLLMQRARPSADTQPALPGWGQPTDVWRVNTALRMDRSLRQLPSAHLPSTEADWIGSFVDLTRMYSDRRRATKFFLEEIALERVVRNWIHNYAVEAAQLAMAITNGNPMDQQLAAHLLDCDVLVTADKRFHAVVSAIREHFDMGMARTAIAIRADLDVVRSVERALEQRRTTGT